MLEKVGRHVLSSCKPDVTCGKGHGGGSYIPDGHEPSETGATDSPRLPPPPHSEPVTESPSVATSSSLAATVTPFCYCSVAYPGISSGGCSASGVCMIVHA